MADFKAFLMNVSYPTVHCEIAVQQHATQYLLNSYGQDRNIWQMIVCSVMFVYTVNLSLVTLITSVYVKMSYK